MQIENGNIVHLGEIARIYQPQTISSTELTEDGFLVYGANGIIGKYKEYNHKTEQICITCRGNTCGMVNYTKPMSWITGIEISNRVLSLYQEQKQYLLRQMFI